jgi:hypothetical protein
MIVLGNLKDIIKKSKGRKFNRKPNNGFPYYRLSYFIEYKARWLRIKVIKVNEKTRLEYAINAGIWGFEPKAPSNTQTVTTNVMQTTMGQ